MRRKYCAAAALTAAVLFTGTGATYETASGAQLPATRSVVVSTTQLPTEQQIAALFDKWNAALATGDPNRVADLYAPDAVLLPTVSDLYTSRAGIVGYFTKFLASKPVGKIQERFITVLDRTSAVDTGLYQFTLTDKNGGKSTVDARYTFVYELRGGEWLILNHHSSVLPSSG
ncbi:SgcJ/EcaC family oxidoreductase [Kitasatospora sp. NPDC018058]|uniref:SgcJ/EcaC family oxidoreductase n=1 Tax=Kitasatospora sp. NPDC018058 TaxID=3364025 RepID=UPI0037BFABCB